MSVRVVPVDPTPASHRWVDQYRFLDELHTDEQLDALETAHIEGLGLSVTERRTSNADPTLMSANGYNVRALKGITRGYELMKALGGRVDLLSPGMTAFFQAAAACGVYGTDAATANAEIARIVNNEKPAA
jgi:hypothetical protein